MIKRFFFSVMIFSALLISCNEEPTDIGINLLQDTIIVNAITTDSADLITGFEVFKQHVPVFNAGVTLLGSAEGTYSATLLRFTNLPDSLLDIQEEDIVSVKMSLYPDNYAFGNIESGILDFNIKKVNKLWKRDTTRYNDLFVSPADYFDNEILTTFSENIDLKDSVPPIEIDLPSKLIPEWTEEEYFVNDDGEQDTILKNFGIALLPNENSDVIRRFHGLKSESDDRFPKIELVYNHQNLGIDTVIIEIGIEASYIDSDITDDNYLVYQGGVSYRTEINFDISALPDLAAIHKTEVLLTVNTEKSVWGNLGMDSTFVLSLYDEIFPDEPELFAINNYTGTLQEGTDVFRFESISSAVETWNRTSSKKGSLVLRVYPISVNSVQSEWKTDKMFFYGPEEPDNDLRPKLKIIYSHIEETDN